MAIVRKDILLAGENGNLEHVIVTTNGKNIVEKDDKGAVTNGQELTNGLFVKLGKLMDGEREVRQATLAGKADAKEEVVFIHNSEVMYDERLNKLADYRISEGKVARAYRLFNGDIITLTTDLYQGNVAVGDVLIVHTNGKLGKGTETETTGAKIKFEVIEDSGYELDPKMKAYAVQIVRA